MLSRTGTSLLTILTAMLLSLSSAHAETYVANLAIVAGQESRSAGESIEFVVNTQRRLAIDAGALHRTLNPDKARLVTPTGVDVDATFQPVAIADTQRQIGTRITFALPTEVRYLTHLPLKLIFEDVGAELVGNHPDLPEGEVAESYSDVAYSESWEFDSDQSEIAAKAWHATAESGVGEQGTLVATADGEYSSPVIGWVEGPLDGSYSRLVVRARREGPTTPSRLLINNKSYPTDATGESPLKEAFDIYTVNLTGNPEWGEKPEKLALRWGHNSPPTDQDKIIIDWVRLYRTPHFAFLGAIREAEDAESVGDVEVAADVRPPMRAQSPGADYQKRTTREAFFEAPPDRAADLPEDKIYPQGQLFGFSLYSVGGGVHPIGPDGSHQPAVIQEDDAIAAALQRVKEDHFTMIGPQYEINHRVIEDAESVGLHCVYTIGTNDDGTQWRNFAHNKNVEYDPETVRQRVREQVEAVADHESIAWWNITPEEMRWWRDTEMQYMKLMYETVKAADPLDRPVYMYEPNNRSAESLAKTIRYQDVSGKGIYANYAGHRDTRGPWIRWSIEQEKQAIEQSGRSHAIPIAVPEMFQQPADEDLEWVPQWARHDAYISMITGAKAMIVFSMRVRVNFPAHEAYYEGFASVAEEVCGPLNLGEVFLFGEVRGDLEMQIVSGPDTVVLPESRNAVEQPIPYPSISFVDLAHGPHRYLIAVNSAYETVETRISGLPGGDVRSESLLDEQSGVLSDNAFNATFAPLEVKAWRFSAAD